MIVLFISSFKAGKTDFLCLFLLLISISLTFSGVTYSEKIFSSNLFFNLGRYSIPLYLNHIIWARFLSTINLSLSFFQELGIYLFLSFISAFVCLYSVNFLKNIVNTLKTEG